MAAKAGVEAPEDTIFPEIPSSLWAEAARRAVLPGSRQPQNSAEGLIYDIVEGRPLAVFHFHLEILEEIFHEPIQSRNTYSYNFLHYSICLFFFFWLLFSHACLGICHAPV